MSTIAFQSVLTYFGALVGLTAILFMFGELLLRAVGIHTTIGYTSIVRNTFVGYIVLTSGFSLYCTRFVSVNLVFIFLLICAAIEVRGKRQLILELSNRQKRPFSPVTVLVLLPLVFGWSWFCIYNPESFLQFNWFNDNILYSKISRSLRETGIENGFYYLNDFDPFYQGPEPYHYFDLWGAALVASVLPLNHYLVLQLIIYPLFYFLTALCFCTLIGKGHQLTVAAIAFALLFTSGYYAPIYENSAFLGLLRNFSINALTPWMNKLSFFYVFVLCAFILYAKGLRSLSILCILGLAIANIIALPILSVSFILILSVAYFHHETKRELRKQMFYVVSTTVLIILIYAFFQRRAGGLAGVEITSPIKLFQESLVNADFRTHRNILLGGLIHLGLFYFPLFPLLISFRRNTEIGKSKMLNDLAMIIAMIILVSLGGWALLFREVNSIEVFVVGVVPLLNCSFAVMVIATLKSMTKTGKGKFLAIASLAIMGFVIAQQVYNSLPNELLKESGRYSSAYLSEIHAVLKETNPKRGGTIKDRGMFDTVHKKFNAVYPMGEYLTLIDESVAVVNIGDFNTPIDSSSALSLQRDMKAVSIAPFFRYVVSHVGPRPGAAEIDSLQGTFAVANKLEFLILSRLAPLPRSLSPYVTKTIIDQNTGERFVLLEGL